MKTLSLFISEHKKTDVVLLEADENTNLEEQIGEPSPSGGNIENNGNVTKNTVLQKKDIRFTIWETVDKKVLHLSSNTAYQRIEYKYFNKTDGFSISFLLGYDKTEKTWKLWCGQIGSVSYSDDSFYSFGTSDFNEAVLLSLSNIIRYVQDVKDNKEIWSQYYINQ